MIGRSSTIGNVKWEGPIGRARHEGIVCRRRQPRYGSAIVEFTFMLPVLLTITLLCVDFGRFAHYYIAVTNAARAGAAYATANRASIPPAPSWVIGVRQAVQDELSTNSWYDPAKLTFPEPVVTKEDSNGLLWRVQVDVTYPFQTLFTWPFLPAVGGRGYNDPLPLHRRVVMRGIPYS